MPMHHFSPRVDVEKLINPAKEVKRKANREWKFKRPIRCDFLDDFLFFFCAALISRFDKKSHTFNISIESSGFVL